MNKIHQKTLAVAVAALISTSAFAADSFEGDTKDAWITGKIETVYLLNTHLNGFKIDTDVNNGIATLSGTVDSEIDRDLAITLAEGVDGVVEVRENLVVDAEAGHNADAENTRDENRSFGTWVDDATTTAAVKSKLVSNSNIKGLQIDVDTRGDVVTLSGRVATSEEKDLAEQLAANTGDVSEVRNNLVVDPS